MYDKWGEASYCRNANIECEIDGFDMGKGEQS